MALASDSCHHIWSWDMAGMAPLNSSSNGSTSKMDMTNYTDLSHCPTQVKRREWKMKLIAELRSLTSVEPIPLPIE